MNFKLEWSLSLLQKYSSIILEGNSKFTKTMMLFIIHLKHRPGIHQDTLADMFKMNRSSVTRAVKTLMIEGFIDQVVDPDNKRANQLFLTDSGHDFYKEVMQDLMHWLEVITQGMTQEEIDMAERVLVKMAGNACKHLGDQQLAQILERS